MTSDLPLHDQRKIDLETQVQRLKSENESLTIQIDSFRGEQYETRMNILKRQTP